MLTLCLVHAKNNDSLRLIFSWKMYCHLRFFPKMWWTTRDPTAFFGERWLSSLYESSKGIRKKLVVHLILELASVSLTYHHFWDATYLVLVGRRL